MYKFFDPLCLHNRMICFLTRVQYSGGILCKCSKRTDLMIYESNPISNQLQVTLQHLQQYWLFIIPLNNQ